MQATKAQPKGKGREGKKIPGMREREDRAEEHLRRLLAAPSSGFASFSIVPALHAALGTRACRSAIRGCGTCEKPLPPPSPPPPQCLQEEGGMEEGMKDWGRRDLVPSYPCFPDSFDSSRFFAWW
ncbi:hypothetical protein MPH_03542 [Macrophomina phaseolina MS6]|uniref:Uncharacterized protein n=1 Tax=Macrophomina phaseolina (strain MS6) TaxID=1126212 RepID=K2S2C7_MACPH|nr:hypothetical protein MPH_03542 [Macrophomina phaseolina MS6]